MLERLGFGELLQCQRELAALRARPAVFPERDVHAEFRQQYDRYRSRFAQDWQRVRQLLEASTALRPLGRLVGLELLLARGARRRDRLQAFRDRWLERAPAALELLERFREAFRLAASIPRTRRDREEFLARAEADYRDKLDFHRRQAQDRLAQRQAQLEARLRSLCRFRLRDLPPEVARCSLLARFSEDTSGRVRGDLLDLADGRALILLEAAGLVVKTQAGVIGLELFEGGWREGAAGGGTEGAAC